MDGWFKSSLQSEPKAVYVVITLPSQREGRKGEAKETKSAVCRLSLNGPPTAVVGITSLSTCLSGIN